MDYISLIMAIASIILGVVAVVRGYKEKPHLSRNQAGQTPKSGSYEK